MTFLSLCTLLVIVSIDYVYIIVVVLLATTVFAPWPTLSVPILLPIQYAIIWTHVNFLNTQRHWRYQLLSKVREP